VEGAILAIADKADSIAGMFALGLQPTGSKDPFALRRAANGVVKIIAEHKLPLPIAKLFCDARAEYKGSPVENKFINDTDYRTSIHALMFDRLEFYLRDYLGFTYDVVKAVLAAGSDDVVDAVARAEAVREVRGSEDFVSISVAFKRMKNIVWPVLAEENDRTSAGINSAFWNPDNFEEGAERDLAMLISSFGNEIEVLAKEKRYNEALFKVAALRRPVDTFFDKVMVMVEDEAVRNRRVMMLFVLLVSVGTIADFSEIVTEGK